MSIEEVAGELYGLPPEDFTAARNARAQDATAGGDRGLASAVKALRKPTAGAHLLNRLVRERGSEVEQVVELGIRLRAAQGTLGPKELRALDDERRRLTRALAQQAAELARDEGRTVSASVRSAVEETLRSAMVDADAGAALLTGLLVDTFTSTGLEPVDLSRVLAVGHGTIAPRPVATPATRREPDPHVLATAREAAGRADATLVRARDESGAARRRAVEAARRREDLRSDLEEVRRRVADLEERLDAATEAEHDARRAQLTATRHEQSAADAAERARRRLDGLLGS